MDAADVPHAVAAGRAVALGYGHRVDAAVVLHDSNRLAVHLRPCDVLARVAPHTRSAGAAYEVEVARHLAASGAPVAQLDHLAEPRVHDHEGFAVTLWRYYEPVPPHEIAPAEYAGALQRLHRGLRQTDSPALRSPHFLDRVAEAQSYVDDPTNAPEIADDDRALVSDTLATMSRAIVDRRADEQLLHGEPHPGNVLRTSEGLLFVDLETCCRGPIEFDIAHATITGTGPPIEIAEHYAGADLALVRDCWLLMLAMVIAWRCEPGDDLPDGAALADTWIRQLRRHR